MESGGNVKEVEVEGGRVGHKRLVGATVFGWDVNGERHEDRVVIVAVVVDSKGISEKDGD